MMQNQQIKFELHSESSNKKIQVAKFSKSLTKNSGTISLNQQQQKLSHINQVHQRPNFNQASKPGTLSTGVHTVKPSLGSVSGLNNLPINPPMESPQFSSRYNPNNQQHTSYQMLKEMQQIENSRQMQSNYANHQIRTSQSSHNNNILVSQG